jgi:hypothetical protein
MPLIRPDEPAPLPGPRCSLAPIYAALPADEREELRAYLTDPTTFAAARTSLIVAALAERGFRIAACTINRHRRGECATCRSSNQTTR